MSRNFLSQREELHRGDYLMSNNGQFKAIFQDDGNFVLYGWKPIWASNTAGSDATRLALQSDCNLVLYNYKEQPKWDTRTYKPTTDNECRLEVTDDGRLLLTTRSEKLWSSDK